MSKRSPISLTSLQGAACASLNPHLFTKGEGGKKEKKAKYGNQRTDADGLTFDSKKEAKRCKELKLMLKKGDIGFLSRQTEFMFHLNGGVIGSYLADFTYTDKEGKIVVEDVKSEMTRKLPVYRLKRRMMWLEHKIVIKEV